MKKINDNEFSLVRLLKFVVIVVLAFAAFYAITVFVTNKKETKKEKIESSIQYDEILIGEILNRDYDSYYVLVENEDNENNDYYYQYVNSQNEKKVFYCDLSNSFNKKYKSTESNLSVTNIDEIKFSDTTLLYIEGGKIINAYENNEDITNILEYNSKTDTE